MTQKDSSQTDFRFPSECRLRKSLDFEQVYSLKHRVGDHLLLIFAAPNELEVTRRGLSVSKKHGNAVCRNRIKRLLREAFRLVRHKLPVGYDLILIPRPGTNATLKEYQHSLKKTVKRVVRKIEKNSES